MRLGGRLRRRRAMMRLVCVREFGVRDRSYGWAGNWAFADVAGAIGASGEGVSSCS